MFKRKKHNKKRPPRTPAFKGAPNLRGICLRVGIMTPRKPNSARRKVAKVKLLKTGEKVFAYIPGQGHNLKEYSMVMVEGGGPKDLPGVNYTLMRGKLDFAAKESFQRKQRRSKYGAKKKEPVEAADKSGGGGGGGGGGKAPTKAGSSPPKATATSKK